MTRGNIDTTKVYYKGTTETYVIFVDTKEAYETWKKDESTPLSQVVSGTIFTVHK